MVVAAVFAGVEAALILTLTVRVSPTPWMTSHQEHSLTRERQPIYERGNEVPVIVVGIIAAVLLAAGLLPPYGEIWKRRGRVIGINWVGQHLRGHFSVATNSE